MSKSGLIVAIGCLQGIFHRRPLWGIAGRTMSKTDTSAPDTDANTAAPATAQPEQGDLASAARKSASKAAWMGTAVGIGSAAIVAALLYTNKKRS